jgi:hypothetical protein
MANTTITMEFTELDWKCLRYFAADPEEWAKNFVRARIYAAKQEIYQYEVRRMTADPQVTTIPADIDIVVQQADIKLANSHPEIPSMTPPGL